jgi:hypothetical protein
VIYRSQNCTRDNLLKVQKWSEGYLGAVDHVWSILVDEDIKPSPFLKVACYDNFPEKLSVVAKKLKRNIIDQRG